GRTICPASADALPRNTNRRVRFIDCLVSRGVRIATLGYVEVVLADHGICAANDQRVLCATFKLSRWDEEHQRRARRRQGRIAGQHARLSSTQELVTQRTRRR